MMDVTVKTLDGQNRSFSVPENITVRQFKEKIAHSISIAADTQRLIFQGRVLQDEKLLKDYDVHGKVVHVVLRPPPTPGRPASNDNAQPSSIPPGRDANSVVVGSFSLPADMIDTNMVQNIAQDAVRSMGDMGRNARVSTRTSTDGSAVDVHIHLGPMQTGAAVSEAQMRLNTARQMMRLAREALNQLENPDGTEQPTGASSSSTATSESDSRTESVPVQETVRETVSSSTENQSAHSPMDTDDAAAGSSTSANQSSESASGEQADSTQQQPRGPVRPNIGALGEVLVEVNELNRRLQPHIERFTRIVQDDAEMNTTVQRENQRVCNMVSEAMHAVSHSYHAISDLMVDLSQNRPRQLYVTLAIAHPHTAVIQQTIPVQAQIQVGGSPRLIRRQFAAHRATQSPTNTSNTTPVSVPSSVPGGATTTTTTTGTSTGPQPSTAETGTQSNEARSQPATSSFGAQHNAGLTEDEMNRLSQQMSTGLQNVLGQGLHQGDGSPDNPYVFVEMGPDSMTLNSISAEVVTTDENGVRTTRSGPTAEGRPAAPSTAQPSGQAPAGNGAQQQPQPNLGQGILPPNFVQNLVQQIVGQTGQSQPQRMQINISHGSPPRMGGAPPGAPMGIRFGANMMRPGGPRNESGTQTPGGTGVPANSGTQTPATPTSASGTQTATSTASTSGTQTPGAPRAAAFVVPGMPGLAQNISPADQYLPCSSRHFLTQHARGILNQAGSQNNDSGLADMVSNLMSGLIGGNPPSTGATPTSTGSTPSTATSTSGQQGPPRPAGIRIGGPGAAFQLGGIPGLPAGLGGIFRGQMPFMQGMRFSVGTPRPNPPGFRPAGSTSQPATTTTGPTSTTSQGSATGAQGAAEPQFVQMLRSMLQSADQNQSGNQTSNSSTAESGGNQSSANSANPNQAISDEAFTQLVSRITGYMSQAAVGQAPRQTISEFLNFNIPQGEGFISDVMSCVLSNLQITDLISVFYGSPAPLNQVQRPLREFLSTRVLDGKPPFQENIRTSVQELVQSMRDEIQETVDSTQPRPHIDFQATLNHFLNQQFCNLVSLVMNSREGDVHFGQDLYACVRRMLSELFILCSRCLGGMQHVERMVTLRLNNLATGVNPAIQDWMSSMTGRQLSQFIPTITVSEGEISHYIVYKEVGQPSSAATAPQATPATPAPKPSTSTAPSSVTSTTGKRDPSPLRAPSPKRQSVPVEKKEAQPMETSSPVSTTSPAVSQTGVSAQKLSPAREVKGAAAASNSNSKSPDDIESQPSPSGAQSADWQSVLPKEWVPVIEQDIQKQRNQSKQQPHSDVYLQGLPPKRRKLMTQDRPGDLSNTSDVLPAMIHRAVAAAGVEPISNMDNLSSELSNDAELHGTFDSNLANTLSQRLESDTDFNKDRFPNSEEYFHKGSKKN